MVHHACGMLYSLFKEWIRFVPADLRGLLYEKSKNPVEGEDTDVCQREGEEVRRQAQMEKKIKAHRKTYNYTGYAKLYV